MALRIIQYVNQGERCVAALAEGGARRVEGARTTYELALQAIETGVSIDEVARTGWAMQWTSRASHFSPGSIIPTPRISI